MTQKTNRPGLRSRTDEAFNQWIAAAKINPGGKCVPFRTAYEAFSAYMGGTLPVTRQYFGTLMSTRFLKRISRASERVSNVHYLLNRDPSQAE